MMGLGYLISTRLPLRQFEYPRVSSLEKEWNKYHKLGTLVTTCCNINSHGSYWPPVMVFPGVNFKNRMINGVPSRTLGLVSPSGWMNSQLFYEVMRHFIKCFSSSTKNSSLIIYNNHESHLFISVLDLAKENGYFYYWQIWTVKPLYKLLKD